MAENNSSAPRPEENVGSGRKRAPLWLALALGVSGVVAIPFFVHWMEVVVLADTFGVTVIHALAPLVVTLFLLLAGLVNPLLARWAPAWRLGSRELLVVFGLWMIAGAVTYTGLVQPVVQLIGTAFAADLTRPETLQVGLLQHLRPSLFLDREAAATYYYGIGSGMTRVSWAQIPWRVWLVPMLFWGPLMLLGAIAAMALVRTVHRQWSRHELLTYPLADVLQTLITPAPGRRFPALFYQRLFWFGFGLVFLVFFANGLSAWFPLMVQVPLNYMHIDLITQFPFVQKYCGREGYSLFRGFLYPFIVAIAVLLPSSLSFSAWAGWILMVLGTGTYFYVTGDTIGPSETGFIQWGTYVAMGAMIAVIGRREYVRIAGYAFLRRRPADPELRAGVTACRVFLASVALMAGLLVYAGFDVLAAVLLVAGFSLVVILTARLTAEIGIPWLGIFSEAAVSFPLRLIGTAALGPKAIALLGTVGAAVTFLGGNSVAAQTTSLSKLAEADESGSSRLLMSVFLGGLVLALASGVAANLWDDYSFGGHLSRPEWSAKMETASKHITRLQVEGIATAASTASGLDRFKLIRAEPGFWRFFLLGAGLVILFGFLRLRFSWWPIHPLVLLLFNTWCLSRLYISFLVGWLIKSAIVRIGGGRVYAQSKPLFIGLIIGQMAAVGFWLAVRMVYFLVTGSKPPAIAGFP